MNLTALRQPTGGRASVDDLPILRLLPDDAPALVANSFVRASFSFGAVLAHEGDVMDAIYEVLKPLTVAGSDGGRRITTRLPS